MRLWLACVTIEVLLALCVRPALAQEAMTFESLLAQFARVPGVAADFQEEKHSPLLTTPLVTKGRLAYSPPGRLLRRIHHPMSASVLIQNGRLHVSHGRRRRVIDLAGQPGIRHFVESLTNLLAGNGPALTRLYNVSFSEHSRRRGARRWRLQLTPRGADLRRWVQGIVLEGRGVTLTTMRLRETSGDETVTTFTNVDAARRWSREEQRQLFHPPSP